jgi:hypothetical protein
LRSISVGQFRKLSFVRQAHLNAYKKAEREPSRPANAERSRSKSYAPVVTHDTLAVDRRRRHCGLESDTALLDRPCLFVYREHKRECAGRSRRLAFGDSTQSA